MSSESTPPGMIMRQPAMRWQDGCPIGNGTIGAMVYGHIRQEQILLNHERLWNKRPKPPLADVSDLTRELRDLLHEGRYEEAEELLPNALQERDGAGRRPDPFLPLGWLHINLHEPGGVFTGYRRGINFTTAEAWTRWGVDDTTFTRRCFASREENIVVIHQSADAPVNFDMELYFQPDDRFNQARAQYASSNRQNVMGAGDTGETEDLFALPVDTHAHSETPFVWFTGMTETDVEYGAVARVIARGGELDSPHGKLSLTGADDVLILVKMFAGANSETELPRLQNELLELPGDYKTLLRPHAASHAELFDRCRITLGDGDDGKTSNKSLLSEAYDAQAPIELVERMYHYGRYLLICSSGELPANLQGIWNGDYAPAWASDYHNDENIQMNYWQAGPGNMPELIVPLMDYYSSFMDDYRENARKLYGADGILVPIVQTTHALSRASIWVYWTAAAGWLAQHFYDYYSFTGDREAVEKFILPWMKGCLRFYEDFLVEDERGQLEFCPSLSPENRPDRSDCSMVTINATMDVAICREVLTHLREICEDLGLNQELIPRCDSILSRLPEYEINDDGAISEWISDEFPDNYHHRHQSHLYPLFPGLEITQESSPELFDACREAVEKRLGVGLTSQTGWSMAHMANIYARLGEGNRAAECLDILAKAETGDNLLTYHNDWRGMGLSMGWLGSPPFQIDANFGVSAAVLEMLVVSTPDCIRLLPGLPDRWETGQVNHIACREQVEVGLQWDQSRGHVKAELNSHREQTVTLRLPDPIQQMECDKSAGTISASERGACYRTVYLPQEETVTFSIWMHEKS